MLNDRLEQELARASHHGHRVGLLFLDLDRFKTINDSLGHRFGDKLLSSVAQRLRGCVRQADTVARMGGDEFVILQPDVEGGDEIMLLAKRIGHAFNEPFEVTDQEVYVTTSIGVAIFPDDGDSPVDLLRNADAAMYLAKEQGRADAAFYSSRLSERAHRRLDMETAVREALRRDGFELRYQPQIDTASGALVGVEALIRLDDKFFSPGEFIPVAEQSGLIRPLGWWVIENACRTLAKLEQAGLTVPKLAVNVSPIQLQDPIFASNVQQIAARFGVSAVNLAIEITETALADQMIETQRTIEELSVAGCQIVLDDFGTGHSSLRYLQQFPINVIKLDQSFVRNCVENDSEKALTAAIVSFAQQLSIPVIAEGVETHEQLSYLTELRCEMAQGYLIDRPLDFEQLTRRLRLQQEGRASRRNHQ